MAINVTVNCRHFVSLEAALRRFRKLVDKEGVLKEYLARLAYEPPSLRRRRSSKSKR